MSRKIFIPLILFAFLGCGGGSSGSITGPGSSSGTTLQITYLSSSVGSIAHGGSFTLTYSVSTNSSSYNFSTYLSQDGTYSTNDTLLGSKNHTSSVSNQQMSLTIPSNTTPGSYYIVGYTSTACIKNGMVDTCEYSSSLPLTVQ